MINHAGLLILLPL